MALSLEQDGQELVDDTDSARRAAAGDFCCPGCVNSVTPRGWPVIPSPRLYDHSLTRAEGIATYNANLAI